MIIISKQSLNKWMDNVEKGTLYVIMVLGLIMLGVMLVHIFCRYVLNSALTWSEEFLKICLVWFSLLSTTIISKRSEHIGIVVFREKFPEVVQKILLRIVRVLMFIACAIVAIVGIVFTLRAAGQFTPSLRISYSVSYAAMPVSFLLMSMYELLHIINGNFMDKDESSSMVQNDSISA